MTTPATYVSTGIGVRTAPNGTRAVTVSTTTTVTTDPEFGRCLDRARAACQPPLGAGTSPAPAPTSATPTRETDATQSTAPTSTNALLLQLRDLIQQLIDRLGQQEGTGRFPPSNSPRPTGECVDRVPNVTTTPATTTSTPTPPVAPSPPAQGSSAVRVFHVVPLGASELNPTGAGRPAPSGDIVVRGNMATEQVTTGAKLDEGIRRVSSFMKQVSEHLRAGGTFTEQQLGDIADEAFAVYREAIRATTGENDLGDFTPAGRDGILDLGATNAVSAITATMTDATAAGPVVSPVATATGVNPGRVMTTSTAAPVGDAVPIAA